MARYGGHVAEHLRSCFEPLEAPIGPEQHVACTAEEARPCRNPAPIGGENEAHFNACMSPHTLCDFV